MRNSFKARFCIFAVWATDRYIDQVHRHQDVGYIRGFEIKPLGTSGQGYICQDTVGFFTAGAVVGDVVAAGLLQQPPSGVACRGGPPCGGGGPPSGGGRPPDSGVREIVGGGLRGLAVVCAVERPVSCNTGGSDI